MASSSVDPTTFLFVLAALLACSAASGFNITEILGKAPNFGVYNGYLTQTHVAGEVNSRRTITVLAVPDSGVAAAALSGLPLDVIKKVLSLHVVLDYYDVAKLQSLGNRTALLVTLFQASGQASGMMGFLNATDLASGAVGLGSAVPGSGLTSQLGQPLFAEPYNISVLQISTLVVPPGIEAAMSPPPAASPIAAPPMPGPAPKMAPAPSKKAPAPSPNAPAPATSKKPPSAASSPSSPVPARPPAAARSPTTVAPSTPAETPPSPSPPTAFVRSPGPSAGNGGQGSSGSPSGGLAAIGTAVVTGVAGAAMLIAL